MSLHPVRIEGTFVLSDGSRTQFTLDLESGWMQWGNDQGKLGCTVDLLDAIEDVSSENGLAARAEECQRCEGEGVLPIEEREALGPDADYCCPICHGTGRLP